MEQVNQHFLHRWRRHTTVEVEAKQAPTAVDREVYPELSIIGIHKLMEVH